MRAFGICDSRTAWAGSSKTKLTQAQVLQRLREGKLTARVEAARAPQGEFRAVRSFPEFRDVPETRRASKPNASAVQRKTTQAAWAKRLADVPWFSALAVLLGLGIIGLILLTASRL